MCSCKQPLLAPVSTMEEEGAKIGVISQGASMPDAEALHPIRLDSGTITLCEVWCRPPW